MSVQITDTWMVSDVTGHSARRTAAGWELSWLPGATLTRDQAITGVTLAETVATNELVSDSPWWPFIDGWAAELGLTGPAAVVRVSEGPAWPARQGGVR